MTQLPLTKRQREIFEFLCEYVNAHSYAPSLEEIGFRFGLSSLATVHKHLENLRERGYIRRAWNRSRSIELLSDTNQCPTCGRVRADDSETMVISEQTTGFVRVEEV